MPRIAVLLLIVAAVNIAAQDRPLPIAIDGVGGVSFLSSSGSFESIPGIPSPGSLSFTSTGGTIGWWLRLGADGVITDYLRGGLRIGVASGSATYEAQETVPIAAEGGGVYRATLTHTLATDITTVLVEPYVRYQPTSWLSVSVGLPLILAPSASYTQTMRFTDPPGLPFLDGRTEIVTASGNIPNVTSAFGLQLSVEGMFPILRETPLYAVPHIGYGAMFSALTSNGALQLQSITVGIGVRYEFPASADVMPTESATLEQTVPLPRRVRVVRDTSVDLSSQVTEPRTVLASVRTDTVEQIVNSERVNLVTTYESYRTVLPRPPALLRSSLRLAFEHEDGRVSDDANIRAQRVRLTRSVPFMPLVVFDEGAAEIPDRYIRLTQSAAAQWKELSAIFDTPIHWQYNVLNVVGSRMRNQPTATIALLTYDDGTDAGKGLAEQRIESVQRYLFTVFGIAPRRITTQIGRGQASQQPWVLITDASRVLLKPITGTVMQNVSRLPRVKIIPDVVAESGITSWSVNVFQSGRTIRSFSDSGAVPASITWNMEDNVSADEVLSQQVLVDLRVTDSEGASTRSEPGRIVMRTQTPTQTDQAMQTAHRVEVLRVLPPDIMSTPDRELFTTGQKFTSIEFYPATIYDEAEYLQADAPVVKRRIDADTWFRRGLIHPEREFYRRAELYINDERHP